MSITISVTLLDSLEKKLRLCAKEKGISRSRFISDILSKWDEKSGNTCIHQDGDYCRVFNITCKAPESEAKTCEKYSPIKGSE